MDFSMFFFNFLPNSLSHSLLTLFEWFVICLCFKTISFCFCEKKFTFFDLFAIVPDASWIWIKLTLHTRHWSNHIKLQSITIFNDGFVQIKLFSEEERVENSNRKTLKNNQTIILKISLKFFTVLVRLLRKKNSSVKYEMGNAERMKKNCKRGNSQGSRSLGTLLKISEYFCINKMIAAGNVKCVCDDEHASDHFIIWIFREDWDCFSFCFFFFSFAVYCCCALNEYC